METLLAIGIGLFVKGFLGAQLLLEHEGEDTVVKLLPLLKRPGQLSPLLRSISDKPRKLIPEWLSHTVSLLPVLLMISGVILTLVGFLTR